MIDQLISAACSLMKREPLRLVAATGLIFRELKKIIEQVELRGVIESYRGGIWGDEAAPEVGYQVLRSTNMRGPRIDVRNAAWIALPDEQINPYILKNGDILVTKSSGSSDLVGKAALFIHPEDGKTYLFSNFTLRLRPDQRKVLPEYVAWFLRSPQSLSWRFSSQQNAVGLRNLQTREFLDQCISVPDVHVQKAIVEYLDALETGDSRALHKDLPHYLEAHRQIVDRVEGLAARIEEARELRRRAVEEAKALTKASLVSIFEGKINIGEFVPRPLPQIAEIARGKFSHRPRNEPRFYGGDVD